MLDIGCGPGRHSLALAKTGYQVTGVDTSNFLLEQAQKQAKLKHLTVDFIKANMLDFNNGKQFDLIINMFNSFGYFDTQDENQQVINNAYNNLKPSGTLLIDTVGKETIARTIEPVHLTEYDNGDIRIERPLLTDNMQVFSNEWILIRGESAYKKHYQHFVYTPVEITHMCEKAGFKKIHCYGSLEAQDYDLESDRLVVVAEK